ncbi:uncharacterized protein I206_107386 [Kwoniella pini CBS 10737]|uniref:Methionyl-tRNA formyltransferase n=1 Tax=Kwoniella pini CBS 10737 TaxID=1296096 RepID=A0A1B9HX52_9TREE|nr:methionyl-tRNA formyltransferase [Kwoniella pini CBS 10737]OCF47852.1 methionyl-tRNA formyltransferase [Kwoniella pini CBS 10737]
MIISNSSAPLGPLASLPSHVEPLKQFRILLLVTSINSFTQRVYSYLQYLGFEQVSVQLATTDEDMLNAAEGWDADIVLCPFLTKKLPESIYSRWITLVVHPGPPGDAGPSSLDWVLMGDNGSITDSSEALDVLLNTSTADREVTQRSHWGTICFQANEELDGGAVWAWEQYTLPKIGNLTKAGLYQNQHSIGAISATIHALIRVYEQTVGSNLPKTDWLKATPLHEWGTKCVTLQQTFLGGPTLDRPLLQSTKRRPNFQIHTAEDILRILNASDSQPGSMLHPLSTNSKTSLFAYGAHLHQDLSTIPASLYVSLGFESFSEIPNGKIIATRQGAIFIKTRQIPGKTAAGVWITHGRVPRGKDKPIDPKISMADAIGAAGHGAVLDGVKEWEQNTWMERPGEWQEVYVKSVEQNGDLAQLVYWNFYNGAFTTANCQYLLKALQWATSPDRGNVKLLALMGGNYFSNGIALNTIENATSPGAETWANINAIDDIVSFLVGDISSEVPPFLEGVKPLSERGIATIACVRGNAAAGGVALAAACDVVIAGRNVVLNPSYRGMGLHGSELHSYSYLKRCGPIHAATLLRAMKPLNTSLAHEWGLVDIEIGNSTQSSFETETIFVDSVKTLLIAKVDDTFSPNSSFKCAPWCRPTSEFDHDKLLVEVLCENKISTYTKNRNFPPLLHYRNEELSQMLLDSFHPIRSNRYHSRRYKFIRKTKASSTPARYMLHSTKKDEEDTKEFDDAPNWIRGEEWKYVNLPIPKSLETSESTRIDIFNYGQSITEANLGEPTSISCTSNLTFDLPTEHNPEEHISESVEMPRKPSEVPTLISSSLTTQPISPTMSSSSSGEGPLPTTPMMEISPTRSIHSTQNQGELKVNSLNSNSKRLSIFRNPSSNNSSIPGSGQDQITNSISNLSINQNQLTNNISGKQLIDQFGNDQQISMREKKGTFRIIKKKLKNALKSLNSDFNSNPNSNFNSEKQSKPLASGRSENGTRNLSNSKSTSSNSITTYTSKNHSLVNKGISSDDFKQNQISKNNCEWPCLVTGGQDEDEELSEITKNKQLVQ